jgi:hypothetical protein
MRCIICVFIKPIILTQSRLLFRRQCGVLGREAGNMQ